MADDLQRMVGVAAADLGLDVEEVAVVGSGSRRILRIVVDADGGVGIDAISSLSRMLSHELDETGVMGQRQYTLEVTSRGISSPLEQPRHWRRNIGRLVKVSATDGEVVTGRIAAATESGATLDVNGAEREVAFADVARAIVQVELNGPQLNREDR